MLLPPLRRTTTTVTARATTPESVTSRFDGIKYVCATAGVSLVKPGDYNASHPSRKFVNLARSPQTSGKDFVFYNAKAAIPALAICASSADFTPETPTAPKHCPSSIIGTPPSSMPSIYGADIKETRPLLIISS